MNFQSIKVELIVCLELALAVRLEIPQREAQLSASRNGQWSGSRGQEDREQGETHTFAERKEQRLEEAERLVETIEGSNDCVVKYVSRCI